MTGKKIKPDGISKENVKKPVKPVKPVTAPEPTPLHASLSSGWITTVTLEYADEENYDTQKRLDTLSAIFSKIQDYMPEDSRGLVVFPGGWIGTDEKKPEAVFGRIEKLVTNQLKGTEITACLGIDGGLDAEDFAADQVGLAINSKGIQAVGRKFHPSPQERGHVNLCGDYTQGESEFPRTFVFNGRTYFIAVCYDTFGIRQNALKNPGVDGVINLVHCFYHKGEGPSGNSYFARHGFAGTSRQWGCPVFGTAVFYNLGMPERWPTGVLWTCGNMSTTNCGYEPNSIQPVDQFKVLVNDENAVVRIFDGEL